MKFMIHNDKVVQPKPITRDKLNRIQLDAKRVLGQAMSKDDSHLEPPQEGSNTWQWAQNMLALNWPVVSVVGVVGYVSLSELCPLPPLPPRPQYLPHSTWLPPCSEIEALPIWKHLDGRELRIIRMHSVTTAFVVEIKYGGLWTSKVHIDDLQPTTQPNKQLYPNCYAPAPEQLSLIVRQPNKPLKPELESCAVIEVQKQTN